MADLGAERSHAARAGRRRGRGSAPTPRARGLSRTVVVAHAFVTGAEPSRLRARHPGRRHRRRARLGVRRMLATLALGHLHGPQRVQRRAAPPRPGTRGSPLAFSFGERHQRKSVTLAEIDGGRAGRDATLLPAPVPRPLRGGARHASTTCSPGPAATWPGWPARGSRRCSPTRPGPSRRWSGCARNGRTRSRWTSQPEGGLTGAEADLARLAEAADPVEICGLFVEFASGGPPDEAQRAVLRRRRGGRPAGRGGGLMRLHILELQAFGPYATAQRIDFDLLARSGLFLLEGPTGAGKTHDPGRDHVRALRRAGRGRSPATTGCARTSPARPPSRRSRLEFSLPGARYQVTRVPEHRRPEEARRGLHHRRPAASTCSGGRRALGAACPRTRPRRAS